jgi:5-methylcytosine-specific restriction endonuclease McrA
MIKAKIPVALREQVWLTYFGKKYQHKCYIRWCKNNIDVFNFQVGHNVPESKGGPTTLENLRPICIRCNQSMSNVYTIDEWNKLGKQSKNNFFKDCCSFFQSKPKNLSN